MAFWEGNRHKSVESGASIGAAVVMVEAHPRPALTSAALSKALREPIHSDLAEYAEVAALVGFVPPDLAIEAFKAFLAKHDIPTFSLAEVVAYMDDKAARESKDKAGWQWRPLRAKDDRKHLSFGRDGTDVRYMRDQPNIVPATDYYRGPGDVPQQQHSGGFVTAAHTASASSRPYDKTVPLHALKKVAMVEREYKGDVAFFVCDYAPAPHITYPDPFLMAVVPNPLASQGIGRFVIDFWDEPNFGIERMIK